MKPGSTSTDRCSFGIHRASEGCPVSLISTPSVPITFATVFIVTTFLLQWWIRPSYPQILWFSLGFFGLLGFSGFFRNARRLSPLLPLTLGLSLALWNVARTEGALLDSLKRIPWDTNVQIEGMITGVPALRQGGVTYTVALRTVTQIPQEPLSAKGKITVRTKDIREQFTHGDIVHIHGSIEHIPPPYEQYFRTQSILGSLSHAVITRTERREGSIALRTLAHWNRKMATRIRDLVPEPEASLLVGLLLGETEGFQKETLAAFRTAGLTHILAVSGYNITLLLIAISVLVARLPRLIRFITALTAVTLFTLFVGASPSAIRAALMGSLGLIALNTHRLPETRRAILWTAFLMLLWNPMQLWWDASFQLSFLAVIGITELQPAFKKFLQHIPDSFGIRETLTVTLAAQCTALPWAAALFGNVPIFSPVANVLVAPAIPFIMITGTGALLGGTVHDLMGRILAFPCWVALQWIIRVAETIALLPLAFIPFPQNSLLPLILYYAALVTLLIRNTHHDTWASITTSTNDTRRASHPPARGESCAPQWESDRGNEMYGIQQASPDGVLDQTSPKISPYTKETYRGK